MDGYKYVSNIYQDIRSCDSAIEYGDYNKAVTDAEQFGEKNIKAVLIKEGKYDNYFNKNEINNNQKNKHKNGHNLEKLADCCDVNFHVSKKELRDLKNVYFESRYLMECNNAEENTEKFFNKTYTEEEAERLCIIASKIFNTTAKEFGISKDNLRNELGNIRNLPINFE